MREKRQYHQITRHRANHMIHALLHDCRITFLIAIFSLLAVGIFPTVVAAETVKVATYEGVINPVTAEYFESVLEEAIEAKASCWR